jgi:hypothetical protein
MLEKIGYEVTTVDIAADTQPDIVGDVTKLDIGDDAFDVVLAAEVLEHIPFEQFETALRELRRVSRDRVIVTLPAPLVGLSVLINLPRISPFGLSLGAPYRRTHKFDGEHYWELGKKGYGKSRILEAIENAGLNVVNSYRPAPSLYTYFFIMAK